MDKNIAIGTPSESYKDEMERKKKSIKNSSLWKDSRKPARKQLTSTGKLPDSENLISLIDRNSYTRKYLVLKVYKRQSFTSELEKAEWTKIILTAVRQRGKENEQVIDQQRLWGTKEKSYNIIKKQTKWAPKVPEVDCWATWQQYRKGEH